jgi:DNA-binding XRE family transcriptional regulator
MRPVCKFWAPKRIGVENTHYQYRLASQNNAPAFIQVWDAARALSYDAGMTTFAETLKKEIARIARKELREEITALRKIAMSQRTDISALKKEVKSLQSSLKKLEKLRAAPSSSGSLTKPLPAVKPTPDTPRGKPGRKVMFTAERLKAQRARLGFTQEQMGQLLGVSSLSIWKWESGGASPRAARVPEILGRIAMGKREALSLIEQHAA